MLLIITFSTQPFFKTSSKNQPDIRIYPPERNQKLHSYLPKKISVDSWHNVDIPYGNMGHPSHIAAYRSSASLHLRRQKQRLFPSGFAGRQGRQGTIRQRRSFCDAKTPQRGEATRPPGTMKHPVFDAGRCGFYWEKVWFSQMSQIVWILQMGIFRDVITL